MQKLKFTKGSLKSQRDSLKQYQHYLPILLLKKQQLQLESQHIYKKLTLKQQEISKLQEKINKWEGLIKEAPRDMGEWTEIKEVISKPINIAGTDIPEFEKAIFKDLAYDLYLTPLWVDTVVEKIRALKALLEEEKIVKKALFVLEHELRITTQRVNLFEKVKIPECKDNIRRIRIYLGDQDANAVGRSKIAKKKIEELVLA